MTSQQSTDARAFVFVLAMLAVFGETARPVSANDAADVTFFETKIRPALVEHCFECHGAKSANPETDLLLDRKLTDDASLIVPGKPNESLLIEAIRYKSSDLQMPPSGRMSPDVIADFETWVTNGAADPRMKAGVTSVGAGSTIDLEAGRDFWSFRPVRRLPPPEFDDDWVQSPIDAFVLKKLTAAKLSPAPRADRRTLIRRATLVLLGVPPNPRAVDDFVADSTPDAFSRLVDRLLASPDYGERWGRHWLDVVRYGDCNGADESRAFPNAWHFRNYIIESFNRDLPYDRMIAEHLAGDLLDFDDSGEYHPVVGTGFLALGTKILTQLDEKKRIADLVDEQIDVFGRAMLGMTIACARCHDHKFDPIPTADYYALAGILRSTTTLISFGKWVERPAHTRRSWMASQRLGPKLAPLQSELQSITDEVERSLASATNIELEAESFARGNVTIDTESYGKGIGIIGDKGAQKNFAEFDINIPTDGSYVLQLRYAAKTARPGRILLGGKVVREPAITQTTGDWHPANQKWCYEGIHPLKSGLNTFRLESEPLMSHIDKLRLLRIEPGSGLAELVDRQTALTAEIAELERRIKPALQVMAVREGDIADAHILVRGNANKPSDQVARGFLQVASTAHKPLPKDQSGRLQLAEWMTRPDHPLTSRVMVNRLWRWHFGRGIVATPDNFGTKGARPSHPELLDYLASRFVEKNWSIKAMHREILNSQTWQMGSAMPATKLETDAENIDPENVIYWEYPRRRLEAEVIRDSLLEVSGRLDRQTGGAPLKLKTLGLSPKNLDQQQQHYDESNRRTIYLPVLRTNVYDFLTLFDFANPDLPTGNRVTTTVPTQAMLMMNSSFVKDAAARVAANVLNDPTLQSDSARIRSIYRVLYSRPQTESEETIATKFIADYSELLNAEAVPTAWSKLCHALLAGGEFIYLR
jgi:cytochrome c553